MRPSGTRVSGVSQPGYPAGTPGSAAVLPPSPLDLGQTLSAAFRVMKTRLAQLVVLALLPLAAIMVLISAAAVPLVLGIVQSASEQSFSPLLILGLVLIFASALIAALVNVKAQGMMALTAHDAATGRGQSGLGELSGRTRGLVGRVLLFYLMVAGVVLVIYGVIVAVMLGTMFTVIGSARSGRSGGEAIATVVGVWLLMMLLIFALGLFAFYLQIRFLYFMPVLAVEGSGAIDSLRRSWRLTKNNVLRTLGYFLVAALIVNLANGAVSFISQAFSSALAPSTSRMGSSEDPAQVLAALSGLAPVLIITMLLSLAVNLLAMPFLTCVTVVMYADQVRRSQLPNGGRGAYGAAYAQPQQNFGGYPNQSYGQAGQGWPQQQPPQAPPQQPGWGQQNPGGPGWGQQPPYQG